MKRALVISERDTVATALEPLEAGARVAIGSHQIDVRSTIPSGHKVALVDMAVGDAVIKYGSPIGTATRAIQAGDHVHTHNVASARGRGDLGPAPLEAETGARLAEPPDEGRPGTGSVAATPDRGVASGAGSRGSR